MVNEQYPNNTVKFSVIFELYISRCTLHPFLNSSRTRIY